MALSKEQKTRVSFIIKKGESLEKRIATLKEYINKPDCSSINAKLRLQSLTSLFEDYMQCHDELASLSPDHPRLNNFEAIETSYFEVATSVTGLQAAASLIANSTPNTSNITFTERIDKPKLPEIKVPTFEGQHDQWLTWKHSFEALVHARTDLSNYVKHTQLINALKGSALNKINSFPPSEENYSKAWSTLNDAYDQKRMIVSQHLDALFDLPILSRADPEELSSLIDKTRQHLSMLNEIDMEFKEQAVIRLIERSLPAGVMARWQDRLEGNQLPKLDDFYKFIQATVFKLRSVESTASSGRNIARKRGGERVNYIPNKVRKVEARSLFTSNQNMSRMSCPKCNENHAIYQCPSFNELKVQERVNFTRTQRLCRNCLASHPPPCKSSGRCKKCNRDHHTLLHFERGSNSENPQSKKEIKPATSKAQT